MSFGLRFTQGAAGDLQRLYAFLAEEDPALAARALEVMEGAWQLLESSPFSCRRAEESEDPFLRELLIPFGRSGYVALFDIEGDWVTVLAVRHQRESDYH